MKPTYSEHINQAARDWFTLLQSGKVTEAQQQNYQTWLAQDPQHQQAIADYQRIWDDLALLGNTDEGRRLKASVKPATGIGHILGEAVTMLFNWLTPPKAAIALAGTGLAIGVMLFEQSPNVSVQTYSTANAETLNIRLEDGSQVSLSAQTTIKTWFTESERHVALVNGQAYFKIAKNPQRPFWVDIDNTLVKVVGTEFDIKKNIDRVKVAVAEGVVNVFSTAANATNKFAAAEQTQSVTLTKGQQLEDVLHQGLSDVKTISVNELAAWRQGKLVYRAEKLKQVIRDANRYSKRPLVIEEALAEQEITAVISLNQIDKLPETLAQLLPINIDERSQEIYLSLKK